ncbi:hypothetical protein GF420_05650 [candidate division GN15 bacterium]|nr:hypothetical protein [candidate division GN15 bacterium]
MCILAHPDDESLGAGGTLAKYADEGVETYLVTATRGERGRFYDHDQHPPLDEVGRVRERELRAAATVLGIKEVSFLDYTDRDLDEADAVEAIGRIVTHLRRVRPHVVITFGPEGGYGHPDHIAISQFTSAAVVGAASADYAIDGSDLAPHPVSKLYYMAWDHATWEAYQAAFRDLKQVVDDEERRATPWPSWALTTRIDTRRYWETTWKAIQCHETQLTIYEKLAGLSDEHHAGLWGSQTFYRVHSLVNGGRQKETDLFAGLR